MCCSYWNSCSMQVALHVFTLASTLTILQPCNLCMAKLVFCADVQWKFVDPPPNVFMAALFSCMVVVVERADSGCSFYHHDKAIYFQKSWVLNKAKIMIPLWPFCFCAWLIVQLFLYMCGVVYIVSYNSVSRWQHIYHSLSGHYACGHSLWAILTGV